MKLIKQIVCVSFILWLVTGCTSTNNVTSQNERKVRYRENIDSLSPEKLSAYIHAVAMMKKKSEANVFDRTGFLWQAWVHNCTNVTVNESRQLSVANVYDIQSCSFSNLLPPNESKTKENPGMCEHAKNTFFQWHRAARQ